MRVGDQLDEWVNPGIIGQIMVVLQTQTSNVSIRSSLIFQQLTGAHRGC